ncbi:hypothetical protein [Fructilactobacillus frigidiflavus]|uniref:hypothetical protein n=1 Tax=Fructilactobacillus frigidiflavus TaxID=3242688 RepID=UPI0037574D0D
MKTKKTKANIKKGIVFFLLEGILLYICILLLHTKINLILIIGYLILGFLLFFCLLCSKYNRFFKNKTSLTFIAKSVLKIRKLIYSISLCWLAINIGLSLYLIPNLKKLNRYDIFTMISFVIIGVCVGSITWLIFKLFNLKES